MKILLTFVLLFLSNLIVAQEDLKLIDFGTNLYAIENSQGGNIAFLVTRRGVAVVDAGSTPNNGRQIIEIIRSVTKKPIKYLILTHLHGDHINGISAFHRDVQIIAHEDIAKRNQEFNQQQLENYIQTIFPNYLENLKSQIDTFKDKSSDKYKELVNQYNQNIDYFEDIKTIKFREPDIIFTDFYRLKIGDERIIIQHPGPGHTLNNVVVKFSYHNVIHTGDLIFNESFPYTIEEHGVDIYNWTTILDDLYKEKIYTVIPGHGKVGEKDIIKTQSDYFKTLAHRINNLKEDGKTLEEIKEIVRPEEFKLQGNENQLPINIEIIYNQIINTKIDWWQF